MELDQEEALYEFLENATKPFTLEDVTTYVQASGQKRNKRLVLEIAAYMEARKIAFKQNSRHWVSRRSCFEPAIFAILPTRLELLNGILIPGHRFVPFANPMVMPHRYQFFWKGKPVPMTTTEAPPEDLYPFYCIFGEEFAPQYIARDNPENEEAYNADPFEEPPEVSIQTLDMRRIYRECLFVPGDRFAVRILDWKECKFELEKIEKNLWARKDLDEWLEKADCGFEDSFAMLGPGSSTEEQIAFAYWYGGKRMREVPAYSLEEYFFEKTNRVETVPFGIETRFWFAGRDIPDYRELFNHTVPPDRTYIEDLLFKKNIPISEFVILSYIKDAFFRNEIEIDNVIDRIIPPIVSLDDDEWNVFAEYVAEGMEDFYSCYSIFLDQWAGPVRQRVAELHTAVIELSSRLQKGDVEAAWLPRHTFIVLSQIQGHAASLLEDLAFEENPSKNDIIAMDNSLDSMIDTFSEVKELIKSAMENFRRSNLTVIHGGKEHGQLWRLIQISISGVDIWRRAIISHECTMEELHTLIQVGMEWTSTLRFRFYTETPDGGKEYIHNKVKLGDVDFHGKRELVYEYGPKWVVKIIVMSSYQGAKGEVSRFVAGEGAAPPEHTDGSRHYKRLLLINETGSATERESAQLELGVNFTGSFDMEKVNRNLAAATATTAGKLQKNGEEDE